ncbi:MAG TPA: hypothetical protein VMZ28_00585 [Kofleriaceae bacterium]|nr:hypothetical protein [Kofleriaceae bacterium]
MLDALKRTAAVVALVTSACHPRDQAPRPTVPAAPRTPDPIVVAPPPARVPPLVIADQPPAAGDIGTARPVWMKAVAPDGSWVLLCQARKDTNRDGTIAIQYGMHGEMYGDEPAPYWVRGDGPGEELDALIAVSPDRGHLVIMHGKGMELVDARTGDRTALRGADTRYIEAGVFDGARALFDGEHLLYLRAAASKRAHRMIVVRRLADGEEHEVDPGNGTLRVARVSGGRVLAVVYDPAPGSSIGISSHSSGPTHTEGGRRCRGDRTDGGRLQLSGTDRRWAPLTGGAAVERPDVLAAAGADLLLRAADGALSLERAGTAVALAPATCGAVVVAHSDAGEVLFACESGGDPAELRLWRAGAVQTLTARIQNPVPEQGYLSDLRRIEHEQQDETASAARIDTPDGRMVVELASGRVRPERDDGSEGLATHGSKVLVRRQDGTLAIRDRVTDADVGLSGALPAKLTSAQNGRLFAAGREVEKLGEPAGVLFDLEAGAVLGTFPGPALGVSATGWVLSPTPPAPGTEESDWLGPLRWVRPTPP